MNERCSGSDLMCEDDRTVMQWCPGCGFQVDTVEETWLYIAGHPVRRRRFAPHYLPSFSSAPTIADFVDQLRAG